MSAPAAAILGCAGLALGPAEARFFREADPWGFILFARNCESAGQTAALVAALRESVGRAAPVLIDQEGGRVARLSADTGRRWLPPLEAVARAGGAAAEMLRLRYRIIAHELAALGIDVNCAPIADLATPATHPFLRDRCYGETPGEVAARARAVAEGLMAGGVLPVLKHIPGHGRARADSHRALPRVEASRADLRLTDFAPFAALSDLPLGMTAHVVYAALDDRPATISAPVIRLIRDELGFDGLLMTDDLSMQALSGRLGARAAAAIAAGCDVALHCNGDLPEMEEVVAQAGPLAPEARRRAETALARRRAAEPVDIAALEAKHEALLAKARDG
ncbi:beta-hexosaminidase [Rhodosalinus halophilus]|uniref:beta-N-acetylhexosaminidase n=1 Tax=Rhodosalinus halophilus TaxID=2259333 RepID=A0A365U780_9RHOB|nr:glycoside hydrolase family 3 N-terminal domain-containing protein [Rhodosalinus halophilus]RBI84076.1 beta-hexosaminidase [Rhodosalinus halophilus]